jgi:flagellar motor switch protein FliM
MSSKRSLYGVKAFIDQTRLSHDRFPMLDVLFDRLSTMISTSFRNFASENIEITLEKTETCSFGSFMQRFSYPSLIIVFKAQEWNNYGIIIFDAPLVFTTVGILLGGRKIFLEEFESRPYTQIECALMRRLGYYILREMESCFNSLDSIHFVYERLETNPNFVSISNQADYVFVSKMKVAISQCTGSMEFCMPLETFEPIKHTLMNMFVGKKYGQDSVWEKYLIDSIHETSIDMKIVLEGWSMSLSQILDWKIGSFIPISRTHNTPVNVYVNDIILFEADIGQKDNKIAIKIKNSYINGEKND